MASVALTAAGAAAPAQSGEERPLSIFAAASLADVLEEWAAEPGEAGSRLSPPPRFNFAASSALAGQLAAGAAADLFVSADRAQVDRLIVAGKVDPGKVLAGAGNTLVVVAPRSAGLGTLGSTSDLLAFERIAVADPEAVPAGVYARTWLENAGLWSRLASRMVPTLDVRSALAAVTTGAVPAAIVYGSDAALAPQVEVIHRAAGAAAPAVRYWIAPLRRHDPHPDLARALSAMTGPRAAALFARYGFSAAGAAAVEGASDAGAGGGVRRGRGLVRIVLFTVQAAAGATLLILVPGVALAWALSRRGWRGRSVVEALVALPLVVPPTAVGFALLALLAPGGSIGGLLQRTFGIEVVFSWRAVVLAAAVVSFPLLVRSARSAFEEVDPRLSGVARTLGRGPVSAFFAVDLPLAWRGVAAGAVLAFARSLGEFGATVLVAGNIPGVTQTLALALFQRVQVGRHGEAWALAGVAALLAFAAVLLSEWLVRRREQRLEIVE